MLEVETLTIPVYKIKETARELNRYIQGRKTIVFTYGYGSFRDWTNFKHIFKQHNPNLGHTYVLDQSDKIFYRIRPIISPSPPNIGYDELLFESSVKEPDSPSLLGALVFLLLHTGGRIWTAASYDFFGRVHFPIENKYIERGISYTGPKQLLLEHKERIRKFINRMYPELDRRPRERAERIFYDLDVFLNERIGELEAQPEMNTVRMLV